LSAIVTDASALLEYLLQTDGSASIRAVLRRPDADLRAPALCDVEVAAGLRRALLRDLIPVERAELALQHYLMLPLTRHGHQALLPRVLALRSNFGAYDACYVALAEVLGAVLLTADQRLARAAQAHSTVGLAT
jgi:predicted nucleic acid-binding protein